VLTIFLDPRWASWNLGVFVCIRCSGIHRGMGTHISRVKSVDLDSWTDEQMQSILRWGNARANKYWEAKLAQGHVPSEAKIENFIRTKYELKRWVMDGPMPDPASLDADGDDDLPLSVVKEKQDIERKASLKKTPEAPLARAKPAPQIDLIGGDDSVPQRPSTTGPVGTSAPPKAAPAPSRATSNKDSLLGLDFMGSSSAQPPRPASATSSGGQSRPDLKQSILSLYATAPRPQPQAQQPSVQPPSAGSLLGDSRPSQGAQSSYGGGLNDAFSSLNLGNSSAPTSPPVTSGLPSFTAQPTAKADPFSNLTGGSFFNPKPAQAAPAHQPRQPSFGGFGDFASPAPAPTLLSTPAAAPKPTTSSSSAMGDLFDLSDPTTISVSAQSAKPTSPPMLSSVFNLSTKPSEPDPSAPTTNTGSVLNTTTSNSWSSPADVWGGGNAWAAPDPMPAKASLTPAASSSGAADFGWGGAAGGSLANQSIVPGASGFSTAPKVTADEEFGGWSSGAAGTQGSSSGAAGSDDMFDNVWK
jgi:stromal membrane-associated protein